LQRFLQVIQFTTRQRSHSEQTNYSRKLHGRDITNIFPKPLRTDMLNLKSLERLIAATARNAKRLYSAITRGA
jgi:hypothetical protein